MSELKVIVREAFFIRKKDMKPTDIEALKKRHTHLFFEDDGKPCESCDFNEDRLASPDGLSDQCPNCAAFKGAVSLVKDMQIGDNKYVSIPGGDRKGIKQLLKHRDLVFKSKQPKVEMKRKIKFTGTLKDYQREAVDAIKKTRYGVVKAPPRSGKCIAGSSMVMTDQGISPIKDLFQDYVLPEGEFYAPSELSIASVKGERKLRHLYSRIVDETVQFTTYHGHTIRGTLNHRVQVVDEDCNLVWRYLDDIRVGEYVVTSRREQWMMARDDLNPFSISSQSQNLVEHQVPARLTSELARLLGYLVANGNLNTSNGTNRLGLLMFTSSNEQVLEDYANCLAKCFPTLKYRVEVDTNGVTNVLATSVYVKKWLEQATGLEMVKAAEKSIPEVLMRGRKDLMLEFLGAYVSCDSWVHRTGVQLCSASARLAAELHSVLGYLGVVGRRTRSEGYARNGSMTERSYYNIHITSTNAQKLLTFITLRKPSGFQSQCAVDITDVLPSVRKKLHELQSKHPHMHWNVNGKLVRKGKLGSLVEGASKGSLAKQGNMSRAGLKCSGESIDLRLLKKLDPDLYASIRRLLNTDLLFSEVVSVKRINKPVRVYDVEVPEGHHFVANGVVNHNTVLSSAAICEIGGKAMILASQREWLDGFYETFCGSETQPALTNAKKKQVGYCKTLEDFEKYDVCLVTVQTFHNERGQKLLKKIRDMFTVLVCDEVRMSAATKYAIAVSRLNTKYRIGLDGTPNRKDGRYVVTEALFGPILYTAKVERLRPRVSLVRTEYKKSYKGRVLWPTMVKSLETDAKRLKLIAKWAIKDAKAGHMVLIPLSQVIPIKALALAINKLAGKRMAHPFWGGLKKDKRKQLIQDARTYKARILVGNSKLVSVGTNIPRASMIYEVAMGNNIENCEQRVARVLTPYEDKPAPGVRIFLDDFNVRRNCLRNEWFRCIRPKFKPIISEVDEKILASYFKDKGKSALEGHGSWEL